MRLLGCSVLLVACVTAGCRSRDREIGEYIATRAVYQKAFDSLYPVNFDSAAKLDAAWVRDATPKVRRLVGPLTMEGLADTGSIRIGTMAGPYDLSSSPEGIRYVTPDSVDVFVSDTALFHAWASQTGGRYETIDDVIGSLSTVLAGFAIEAAPYVHAVLPVEAKGKRKVNAVFVHFAQDDCPQCSPNTIVVSMLAGERLFVAQQEVRDTTPPSEKCQQLARDYYRTNPRAPPSDETAMNRTLACHANELKSDARLRSVTAKAQALIDRFPNR